MTFQPFILITTSFPLRKQTNNYGFLVVISFALTISILILPVLFDVLFDSVQTFSVFALEAQTSFNPQNKAVYTWLYSQYKRNKDGKLVSLCQVKHDST